MLTGTLSGSRKITVADGAEIVLKDANITSLSNSAAIGSGYESNCGDIAINGGTVTANGGGYSPGIGSGYGGHCGDIFISASANVTVDKGIEAPNDIGAGEEGTCGTVTIEDGANIIYK